MLQALYSPFVAVTMVTPEVMVIFPHWLLHPYSLPGLALPQISYGWRLRYGAQPQWIFGLLLNLVRGASSVERLSDKKTCLLRNTVQIYEKSSNNERKREKKIRLLWILRLSE